MAVSIKLKDHDKNRLDELRAKLLIRGIKLNQEELLSRLIDLGEMYLLDLDTLPMKKLSENRKKEILARPYKLGSSSEDTIDLDVYSGN